MKRSVKFWVRGIALPLTLLLGLSIVAPRVDAQELRPAAAPTAPSAPDSKPLAAAAAAKLAALAPAEAALATTTTQGAADPNAGDAKSFFKSPKGVLALVLAVAGVSYVMYSSHHDRLHSGVR